MHDTAAVSVVPATTDSGGTAGTAVNSSADELSNSCQRDQDDRFASLMEDAIPASTERKYKVLYLFSGPRRQEDGFERQCQNLGIECTCIDIEYDASHNLLDQAAWERIEKDLPDYDGFLITPPCSTFTAARSAGGKGPKPLRGIQGKDRYGLKTLKPHQKEKVKEGTLLALRGHGVAKFAQANSKPWIVEQPHWRPGQTSMYMLDEYMDLAKSRMTLHSIRLINVVLGSNLRRKPISCQTSETWNALKSFAATHGRCG